MKNLPNGFAKAVVSLLAAIGVATILFLIANIIAARLLIPKAMSSSTAGVFDLIIGPQSQEGLTVFRRMFNVKSDDQALARHTLAPNFAMHPGLHFITQPIDNRHYRIRREGIRYEPGWDDAAVESYLANRAIFLMGGSTVMGHGVSHDETISYFWNKSKPANTARVLNFGSQAYDFQRAAEKLAYLLRIGYRPSRVIFLVGWNEINLSARSNMRWQDKVIYHGFSINRGETAYTRNTAQVNYLPIIAEDLPIVQYLQGGYPRINSSKIKPNRDPFVDGFDFREAATVFADWEPFAVENRSTLFQGVVESFKSHIAYVKDLGRGFGFDVEIVFQPMGLFDDKNPFVPDSARRTPGYDYLKGLRQHIRTLIAAKQLDMTDGSDWLSALSADRYVDVAHYSPEANALLAKKMSAMNGRK